VLYFALRGYKPHRAATWNEASTVTIEAK